MEVSGRELGRGIFMSTPSTLKQKSKIQRASKFIGENEAIADRGEERPFSSLRVTRIFGSSLTEMAPLPANVPPSQASFTQENNSVNNLKWLMTQRASFLASPKAFKGINPNFS